MGEGIGAGRQLNSAGSGYVRILSKSHRAFQMTLQSRELPLPLYTLFPLNATVLRSDFSHKTRLHEDLLWGSFLCSLLSHLLPPLPGWCLCWPTVLDTCLWVLRERRAYLHSVCVLCDARPHWHTVSGYWIWLNWTWVELNWELDCLLLIRTTEMLGSMLKLLFTSPKLSQQVRCPLLAPKAKS